MQHVNTLASLPKGGLAVVIGRPIGPLHLPSRNGEWHGLALTEDDIDDVAAFLVSLTSSDYKEQGLKELARQRLLTGENSAARNVEGSRTEAIPA